MIRSIPVGCHLLAAIIGAFSYIGKRACDEIVYKGYSLSTESQRNVRQKQVVIYDRGSVGDLYKNILSQ